jgi:hypothetical protein
LRRFQGESVDFFISAPDSPFRQAAPHVVRLDASRCSATPQSVDNQRENMNKMNEHHETLRDVEMV